MAKATAWSGVWGKAHGLCLVVRNLLAALGLLQVVVTFTPATRWWVKALAGRSRPPTGEVLIVLGGDVYNDGTIGPHSYWRCLGAAASYRRAGYREILISGGGTARVPIAAPIRDCLVGQGVPAGVIRLESAANSTRENALNLKAMLGSDRGRVALMTSDAHMFRARRVFARVGIEVLPLPAVDIARSTYSWLPRWSAFLNLSQETAKILYYYARGWI